MKIKHSKFRNTGLIYELLIKQIAADTLENRPSPAIKILKKYYSGKSFLAKEYKLYEYITKNKGIGRDKAETVLSTITEISRKLDQASIKNQKYNLISDIKESYKIEHFFSAKVRDYKALAALYCLLEAQNNYELVDPQIFVDNKTTILEHLTEEVQDKGDVRQSLIEEYSNYEKDLKLLTYKILLEKFNKKYATLLPEQKKILKEFITSVDSTTKLREYVNSALENVKLQLTELTKEVQDDIIRIKLNEVVENITPVSNKQKVDTETLAILMQYYELIKEIKEA
tara:strand:- start:1432 stop:2286 length:855 start_codon:yes stop_codon:yes gene_type:complete